MLFFLIPFAVLILAVLGAGYYVFTTVFDRKYQAKENNDPDFPDSDADLLRPTGRLVIASRASRHQKFSDLPLKELEVTSFDGIKLKAYLLEGNPKEAVILVHGYRSGMEDDFSDKMDIYLERGTTMLFLNNRAHGNSGGRFLGFSEHDRKDVAKWVDKLNEMYDDPAIYLHGVSMGGATVIHCADMELKNVRGIVDDCGFDSILGISKALISGMYHVPYFPIGYAAWFWSKILNNVDFNTSVGERCVRNAKVPIVFIHGKDDNYVPARMSVSMYEACTSPKELHLIENCGHVAAYLRAPEEYKAAVYRLMDGMIR